MNLDQKKVNGYCVLFVHEDRIDAHNSGELKTYLLHQIEQGQIHIIVQLEDVRFIDSSGLGALLSGHKNAITKSGKLALVNVQKQVLSMFELTRLNRVFEIYATVDEALNNDT
ncbi:STAS domain-containing protein [Crenothrix sp.]|uniref:STAS domain-containing protein n=1 Tax=Crenothrix sp. TaxID=3100433 RepID=UPI00374D0F1E